MKQHKLNIIQRVRAGKSALTNKAHSLTRFSGWGGFFLPQFERFPGKQRRSQIAIRINSCLRKENIFWTKPVWAASLAEILFCNTRRLSLFWEPSWQLWCIHALHTHVFFSCFCVQLQKFSLTNHWKVHQRAPPLKWRGTTTVNMAIWVCIVWWIELAYFVALWWCLVNPIFRLILLWICRWAIFDILCTRQ